MYQSRAVYMVVNRMWICPGERQTVVSKLRGCPVIATNQVL